MTKCCNHCGQPLPLPMPFAALTPMQRRIVEVVRSHPGITADELTGLVYAEDPNGGPESTKCVQVHICKLNKRLAPLGLRVRGQYGRGNSGYRYEPSVKA